MSAITEKTHPAPSEMQYEIEAIAVLITILHPLTKVQRDRVLSYALGRLAEEGRAGETIKEMRVPHIFELLGGNN